MSYVPPTRVMMAMFLLCILSLISFFFSQTIIARDTITPTQPLADKETLISGDGTFALGFFSPGSSSNNRYVGLWYNKDKERTVVWVANRKNPVPNSSSTTGVLLSISNKGNLVITNQNSTVVWSSGTTNLSNPVAQLLNTGNLVVRDDADVEGMISYAWQGFDYPTDTLIAGMKLGVDLVTGLNRTLTAWTSDSDPSPSPVYAMMEVRGDPELVLCEASKKVWRSGPWNGLGFSIPAKFANSGLNFIFINNEQEITFSFNTSSSYLSKVTVNQSGALQQSLWVEDSGLWNVNWYAPKDQCDTMPCGPFAVCNPNNLPICDCIQGFTPKSPAKWLLYGHGTDGCVRQTKLDCKNGTDDGFHVIPHTKLADASNASVDKDLSLVDCRTKCLSNCSCTAYAQADVRDSGSGCIIWTSELTDLRVFTNYGFGQDLYVRLDANDLGQSSTASRKSSKWVIPFVIIHVSMVLILVSSPTPDPT